MYIHGPLHNSDTGRSYYIVIFGPPGEAWVMIPEVMAEVVQEGIDNKQKLFPEPIEMTSDFTVTLQNVGIRAREYDDKSKYARTRNKKMVTRIMFIYSCDANKEESGYTALKESFKFIFKAMKKCKQNPVGPRVVDFIISQRKQLFDFLMKKHKCKGEKELGELITKNVDEHFKHGYNLVVEKHLDKFLADYDIIQVLEHIGYSGWDEVSMEVKKSCYKKAPMKTLPNWGIEMEPY